MAAANVDFLVDQGATFYRSMTLRDEEGDLIDLTGWSFRGKIKSNYNNPVVAASFTFDTTLAAVGVVGLSLSALVTEGLYVNPPGSSCNPPARPLTKYIYDIEAIKPDTTVIRLLQGKVSVSPEVTTP